MAEIQNVPRPKGLIAIEHSIRKSGDARKLNWKNMVQSVVNFRSLGLGKHDLYRFLMDADVKGTFLVKKSNRDVTNRFHEIFKNDSINNLTSLCG